MNTIAKLLIVFIALLIAGCTTISNSNIKTKSQDEITFEEKETDETIAKIIDIFGALATDIIAGSR